MADLLFELFSEEIPSRFQENGATYLANELRANLKKQDIKFDNIEIFWGARRICANVVGLPIKQDDQVLERKGPKVGATEKALEGFLRSAGLTDISDCEIREVSNQEYYFVKKEIKGRATKEVLQEILTQIIEGFYWPKSMRWGDGELRWVRPLRSILALFGEDIIAIEVEGLKSSNKTFGHRFLAPDEIEIENLQQYINALEKAFVIIEPDRRKAMILEQCQALSDKLGYKFVKDEALLNEVSGLVEWPNIMVGKIDNKFVAPLPEGLPVEVLQSSMGSHQKYFTLKTKGGMIAPFFIFASNMITDDDGKLIIMGNEKVLRARLEDAAFFWELDRKNSLNDQLKKLSDLTYHAKIGSVLDKSHRLMKLSEYLAEVIGANSSEAMIAGKLAKADLVSEVVKEFTDLQGVMGGYYAKNDGLSNDVARAISSHYNPKGMGDNIPVGLVSQAVALADKVDSLCGFWLINEKPTGSKDPFALRRAAIGVIRIILEADLRVNIEEALLKGIDLFSDNLKEGKDIAEITDNLFSFKIDRLKVYLKDRNLSHEVIDAVISDKKLKDIWLIARKANALNNFLHSDDGTNLLAAFKRAQNILQIEEKKDGLKYNQVPDEKLFTEDEEYALYNAICNNKQKIDKLVIGENYEDAMAEFAKLRVVVDDFFDKVMVNDENKAIRINRLNMLSLLRDSMQEIAQFGLL